LRKVYFDHNASTPVHPEVAAAVQPFLGDLFGNPSSIHWAGRDVRKAVEDARAEIASFYGCRPLEVVFTSSGTEADNLAVKGVAYRPGNAGKHIVTSRVEHPAIMNTCLFLESQGFRVTYVPVNRQGIVEPEAVRSALENDTILVSVMAANNETGCLMPIAEIGAIAREAGVLMHTDAVQATGKVPLPWESLPVDLLTFSGHKVNGIKGAGGLVVRKGIEIEAVLHGGHQERGRRGGTENLPGIVGFGVAAECAARELKAEAPRLLALRGRLEAGLRAALPDTVIHGERAPRLPNTVNASFPGARSDHLLMALDARGVCVSAGAACASGAVEPSPVLQAMGVPRDLAVCALRLSMGRDTRADDVDRVIAALGESVRAVRGAAATAGAKGA